MKVVYIAHPISGDVRGNIDKVIAIVRRINLEEPDVLPFAPYIVDLLALDDGVEAERKRGFKNNTHLLALGFINELWLFGDKISTGMQLEVAVAAKEGLVIRACTPATIIELPKHLPTFPKYNNRISIEKI